MHKANGCLAGRALHNAALQHYLAGIQGDYEMANNRFKAAFGRIADVFAVPTRQKIENDYLERSCSIQDVERRMREIERGKFRNY